jgi:hypothetical protein
LGDWFTVPLSLLDMLKAYGFMFCASSNNLARSLGVKTADLLIGLE